MPTKRVTRKRPVRPETSAPMPELSQEAIVTILESRPLPANPPDVDAETRRQLIAAEAYFLAERRGFAAGREFDDWVEAERVVEARLQELRAA
jgi:DUF2934 family protein